MIKRIVWTMLLLVSLATLPEIVIRELSAQPKQGKPPVVKMITSDTTVIDYIKKRCKQEHISVPLVYRMIKVESNWRGRKNGQLIGKDTLRSLEGACGLMQVMLPTARAMMKDTTITEKQLLTDDTLNVECGIRYLSYLIRFFDGDVKLAITAYNRGQGTVKTLIAQGKSPYNGYTNKVMQFAVNN